MIKKIADKLRLEFREKIGNPILGKGRCDRLNVNGFTIISNNCWGGHVYRYFQLSYDSPTIGLYFFAEDYVKFVYDLRKYLEAEIRFVTYRESRYKKELERKGQTHCPIGVIDDIEIVFLHYKTPEEALEKWTRRKKRIHWDQLVFKMSEQNLCTAELLRKFDALPARRKLVFIFADYGLESQVLFKEYLGKGEVANDTIRFRKYVDLINWINGKPFKRRLG
ncbi:DUF1919 domain-containing protein [Parabacteroides sp.]|uniref:DUF1919 domain-containing protein n=1 Tax=Parabacteroides sp. TaxID=1869337 RepID=UPI002580F11E|nr:DUF1919 domain-containing protein [Parabacteroides sp.]